ncbi:hypothetical protein HZC53_00755 [Candidatus Uhrbacteria bacterium]|nr:hypothetical protein [Candidatus Uhrbacteria bacterium]
MDDVRVWVRFFIGTPRRFLATASVFALAFVLLFPGLLKTAAFRLVEELGPVLGLAIQVAIVLVGLRLLLSPFLSRGKK